MLSRFADAGQLRRVAQGVYMDADARSIQIDDLRAAWLSTQSKALAEERIANIVDGVVVANTSDRYEFFATRRRQTQRTELRYRQRTLES